MVVVVTAVIAHYHIITNNLCIVLQSVKPEVFPCFTALVRWKFDAELT